MRFHGPDHPGNSFNPYVGKDWKDATIGARFSPFPDQTGLTNVPALYLGDDFGAAALESVFHAVPHKKEERKFPAMQLGAFRYSEFEVKRDLEIFELVNSKLNQLPVPGRENSLTEGELIHTETDQYPNTRTWARFLYLQFPQLKGFSWRPRLGGKGLAYVLFGADRCESSDLILRYGPVEIDHGPLLTDIRKTAEGAQIKIVHGLTP